jgi:hypothetical protein
MRKIPFVAFLYLFGLIGLFLGGGEIVQKIRFELGSESAVMTSTDPVLARTVKYNPTGSVRADVEYETSHGTVPVHDVYLSADKVHKLAQGEGIPLRYMKSNPYWTLGKWEELPSGIGWLAFGVIALGTAVFAHRLLRREAGLDA